MHKLRLRPRRERREAGQFLRSAAPKEVVGPSEPVFQSDAMPKHLGISTRSISGSLVFSSTGTTWLK